MELLIAGVLGFVVGLGGANGKASGHGTTDDADGEKSKMSGRPLRVVHAGAGDCILCV